MKSLCAANMAVLTLFWMGSCRPQNTFTFCRDFNEIGCVGPQREKVVYSTVRPKGGKTIRDYANSVYFGGNRLAFEIKDAYARKPVSFECLKGHYAFSDQPAIHYELEYIELRENTVYGLVMLGSLIEKKFAGKLSAPYEPLPEFGVFYSVNCGKDLLASGQIMVRLE